MRQFNVNRRMLSIVLCIVLICTFTLSIAYAALSAVLTINGNAEVVASNWNIHLDNPRVTNGSVTKTLPVISGNTMTFSSSLVDPGDFYEFTVNVVNDGSIDAMIDSVSVTPTLTDSQKKYLRYEVTYQNGESISSKQTLRKGSSMPIKVIVEFRSDIPVSDLPSTATSLNHKVTLIYSQSDGTGSSVIDDGVYNLFKVGNELCLGEECFYVISSDETTVTMLAKYNLYVGGVYNNSWVAYGDEATGKQDSTMLGVVAAPPFNGTTPFAKTNYWSSTVSSYPTYVYNENSLLYTYVENYKIYLTTLGITPNSARLISYDELINLGCIAENKSCRLAPSWVYSTSYWTGSAHSSEYLWFISISNNFNHNFHYSGTYAYGVRPVITIPKWQFADEIEFYIYESKYVAKEGMTWEEWVNSSYCDTDWYGIAGEYIGNHPMGDGSNEYHDNILYQEDCDETGEVCGLATVVNKGDVIIPGHVYVHG